MSKKIIGCLVVVLALSMVLVACGGSSTPAAEPAAQDASAETAAPADDAAAAEATAPAEEAAAQEPAPMPGAEAIDQSDELTTTVSSLAEKAGMGTFEYEAWKVADETTWDVVLKYYDEQAKAAGWSGEGTVENAGTTTFGIWKNADNGSMLVVIYTPAADGTPAVVVAVVGTAK